MLIDQSWEEFERQNPLVKFSFYLWGRVRVLFDIRIEILQCLDNAFASDLVAHESLSRAEMLSWLWILGAYEVVRTMCQADTCFSLEAAAKLRTLKRKLAIVRMPAAKMEKIGKSIPVTSGRSAAGIDLKNKDILVGDPSEGHSARELLNHFYTVFSSLQEDDILAQHESRYRNKN